jgi:hypothetical protein
VVGQRVPPHIGCNELKCVFFKLTRFRALVRAIFGDRRQPQG